MDTTVYVSTYSLKKQIDKSFKTIIKYRNTDLKIINDNLYIINYHIMTFPIQKVLVVLR